MSAGLAATVEQAAKRKNTESYQRGDSLHIGVHHQGRCCQSAAESGCCAAKPIQHYFGADLAAQLAFNAFPLRSSEVGRSSNDQGMVGFDKTRMTVDTPLGTVVQARAFMYSTQPLMQLHASSVMHVARAGLGWYLQIS